MADEITISADLRVVKDFLNDRLQKNGFLQTLTGNIINKGVQVIGYAAHELVTMESDMGTPGWAAFVNLDSVDEIRLGRDVGGTFYEVIALPPGAPALFKLACAKTELYAIADPSGASLQKFIIEE